MMKAKDILAMEEAIKENISLGFFEQGTHTEMDLVFYEAYSKVMDLRMILEEFESNLRRTAEELIKEVKQTVVKPYIEMNESERVLNRIHNDVDWAFVTLAEGLPYMMTDCTEGIAVKEISEWQGKAADFLLEADECILKLIGLLKQED